MALEKEKELIAMQSEVEKLRVLFEQQKLKNDDLTSEMEKQKDLNKQLREEKLKNQKMEEMNLKVPNQTGKSNVAAEYADSAKSKATVGTCKEVLKNS